LTAADLHRRAVDESSAGRYGRASSLLHRALTRTSDPELSARILVSMADTEFQRGSLADGLKLCDRALTVPDVSSGVLGLIHAQRAMLLMRSGENAAAVIEFDRALPLLESAPVVEQARLHLNRGIMHLQAGDLARSLRDLTNCVGLGQTHGLEVLRAKAQHNLGYVYLLSGDLIGALVSMDAAWPTLAPLSPAMHAMATQDRAEVLLAAGQVADAAAALRAASVAFGSRRLRQRQGQAELVLARLLLMSDETADARRVARQASRRFRRRGSEVWALRADLVAQAAELAGRRGSRDAEDRAAGLADALAEHGLRDDARLASLLAAQAALRTGDLVSAQDRLRKLRLPASAPPSTRLLHRQARAELAVEQRRRGAALRHAREGLDDLHAWQSSFGSLDLQTSLFGHGQSLARLGLSLAVEDGRPAVVFEWFERARALASRVAPVRPPADSTAAAALTELRRLQVELRQAEGPTTELTRRATKLREQIRQRSWYGAGADLVVEPASLDEVRDVLAARHGALIS
jgi:tetratricopeptide (TPR) repeat protein